MGAPLRAAATTCPGVSDALGGESALPTENPSQATDREQAPVERARQVRNKVLERLSKGAALEEILDLLVREMEFDHAGTLASILLLDETGRYLHVAAAPNLPGEYRQAMEGIAIGPNAGSCGTAAFRDERVIVSDIATDPLWAGCRDFALRHGLRACWSEPIHCSGGGVLGTFAVYYRSIRAPEEAELRTIVDAANLASIAIERKRAEERIARLTNLARARSEISQFIVRTTDEDELLSAVCRVAVEFGGMRMAWIGRANETAKRIEPMARYGEGLAYLDGLIIATSADVPEGRGPTGRTFRNGDCVIVNNFETNASTAPWRARAQEHEFRSAACFAIHRAERVFAVLSVYSSRTGSFDSEAIGLLREITKDVGFALDGLDKARERKAALEALSRSEQHFRAYFERSMVGMAATNLNRRWIEVNDALCAMLGYTREELLSRTWAELTHPDDLTVNEKNWERVRNGETDEYETDKRYLHKDGHPVDTHIAARAVRTATGEIDYIVALIEDITERKRAERALREKNEFLNSILQSEPECVMVVGLDGQLLQMNHAGLRMLGARDVDEAQRSGLLSFVLAKYRRAFLELHATVCKGGNGVLQFEVRGNDGVVRWLETHATPLRESSGAVSALLGITRDISEKKRSEELIWRQANFDILTGLPNRYMFQDRLAQEVKKARRAGTMLALLFIDLDYFKEVNDTLGHETGDALLVEVAQRITSCVRESDTVARLGGDEFTVILPQLSDPGSAEVAAQSIIARLGEVFHVRSEAIFLSASIGITYFPSDAGTVDDLLKNADQAMYVAKRQGRNRIGYFTVTLQAAAQNRLRLINDLRGALVADQFRVYFQPVIDLATRQICGAEALLRWLHPTRGIVAPGEFITLAEETGLIIGIGDWVFREAARWAKRWSEKVAGNFRVGVNNSPIQFRDGTNILSWLDYLRAIDLPGKNMSVEITEGLLLDADAGITDVLRRLHEDGIGVAIDDFGTGYSSLSYLHKFQIDCLKIDQSFTRNLQAERSAKALSESIIAMAHKLGLTVVAEGVETAEQLEFLVAAGCDFAQGYLFSHPVPPEEFDALLQGGLSTLRELPNVDW